jgi:glycosyltransferase involved in cell wall biosynthesis
MWLLDLDKGVVEYLQAAKNIKLKYPNTIINLIGPYDDEYLRNMVEKYSKAGYITYLGPQKNVYDYIKESTCVVLPSYGEGRGTVLQEGAAVGRPLVTTDTFGCKDNVEDGVNGYLCKVASSDS